VLARQFKGLTPTEIKFIKRKREKVMRGCARRQPVRCTLELMCICACCEAAARRGEENGGQVVPSEDRGALTCRRGPASFRRLAALPLVVVSPPPMCFEGWAAYHVRVFWAGPLRAVQEMNKYLAALPVHNDIPKIAAAGLG
jgi:hypothetical protein